MRPVRLSLCGLEGTVHIWGSPLLCARGLPKERALDHPRRAVGPGRRPEQRERGLSSEQEEALALPMLISGSQGGSDLDSIVCKRG